jgi:hypothetical protein
MHNVIHPKRPARLWRVRVLALATLVSGVVLAGCGGGSASPTGSTANPSASSAPVATTTGSSATTSSATASAGPATPTAGGSAPLAFAECMRANGVPNFPDPSAGGGFVFQSNGVNPSSPVFMAAQAKCRKVLPGGGPPGPGAQTHPSAQTLTKLVRIAECMRQHGVPDFPDPRTSVPSNVDPGTVGEITDFDGAILLFPATMNMQAPAYKQALSACGAPPLGLRH